MEIHDGGVILAFQKKSFDGSDMPNGGDINLARAMLRYMEETKSWKDEAKALSLAIGKATNRWRVRTRSVGRDWLSGCFVSGEKNPGHPDGLMANICLMSVPGEAEHVAALLGEHAFIAHYHGDPEYPQVKVGACEKHIASLNGLYMATSMAGYIDAHIVAMCRNLEMFPPAAGKE